MPAESTNIIDQTIKQAESYWNKGASTGTDLASEITVNDLRHPESQATLGLYSSASRDVLDWLLISCYFIWISCVSLEGGDSGDDII